MCIYIYREREREIERERERKRERERERDRERLYRVTTQHTTTACVPSFFRPGSREASEVVVRRALGLYVQQKLLEI